MHSALSYGQPQQLSFTNHLSLKLNCLQSNEENKQTNKHRMRGFNGQFYARRRDEENWSQRKWKVRPINGSIALHRLVTLRGMCPRGRSVVDRWRWWGETDIAGFVPNPPPEHRGTDPIKYLVRIYHTWYDAIDTVLARYMAGGFNQLRQMSRSSKNQEAELVLGAAIGGPILLKSEQVDVWAPNFIRSPSINYSTVIGRIMKTERRV